MATSAVLFKNSTPQSMKDNKLYNDENKFTEDDLQDVLDGLLKLGVSDNNNTTTTKPKIQPHSKPPLPPTSHSPPHKTKKNTSPDSPSHTSPNRHNPSYQQPPSFIASNPRSKNHEKNNTNIFFGFNLLYEAAKKVEGVSHFKMDIADVNRITRKIDDIDHQLTYNQHTGILKKKSKNGISPPRINNIDELMDDPHNNSITFADLNDDFTLIHDNNVNKKLRFSEITVSTIGRRSSMYNRLSSPVRNNVLSIDQQQQESQRLSREWSTRNIKEMDKVYDDKTKLKQIICETQNESQVEKFKVNNIGRGAVEICSEFSQSNNALTQVVNTHLENVNAVHEYKKTRMLSREKENGILLQQLKIMEQKIAQQKLKEIEVEKTRKNNVEQMKVKMEQMAAQKQQKAVADAAFAVQKRQELEQKKQSQVSQQIEQKQNFNVVPQNNVVIDEKKEWYPFEEELAKVYKYYKQMYKQCEQLVNGFEGNNSDLQCDLEMHIGLIVRSISSNQKSVFEGYKRFQKLVDGKSQKGSIERQYCFIEITKLIICDVRIVKSSAQKFASSYFLSFVMNQYRDEYFEIFKCMFYHYCIWTIPYIDKQLRDLKIKRTSFDNNKPSIVRCVCLGYLPIKDIKMVPEDKRKFLQEFTKTNDAGKVIFESENKYFTRTQHICGLFAAFMSIRNEKQFINPFGIDSQHCWKWIVYLLGLPQCMYPELCSILSGIIQIIGHDMLEKYPTQFPKIIRYIYENMYQKCNQDTTTRAKAKRELNLFLRECQKCMQQNNGRLIIKKPKESKLIAKTVGATALTNIG